MNRFARSWLSPLQNELAELRSLIQPDSIDAPTECSVLRVSRRAMATEFEIALPVMPSEFAIPAAQDALDCIDEIEQELTVYRDDSEVSELNRAAGIAMTTVEPRLFSLLQRCAQLTRLTEGAFDIATGALIQAWGFQRRQGRIPTVAERTIAMAATGMRFVALNEASRGVRFLRPQVSLNFGAIGKGDALDQAAIRLRDRWQIRSALLHGGASSVLALGTPPGHQGWVISIRHPWEPGQMLGEVVLKDQALGTSAATYQFFEHERKRYGHILDPRQGRPAEGIAQVSVVANDAATADALSTALYVLGVERAERFCRAHPHVGAIILPDQPGAMPLVLNLTRHDFRQAGVTSSTP